MLSGGGAKGIAHIPVLAALDRLGVRPDLVVGTSVGSIIGALYASGYSAAEVDSISRRLSPADLFSSADPRPPRPWRPMTPLLVWEKGEAGLSLRSPAVREREANAMLSAMLLRGNLLARGDFDRLPIPFRAVATDLATRRPVLLAGGDLAQAVRASIAVPLVFPPETIDSTLLTDGGLSANVPVELARSLGATRVIVSDVSGPLRTREEITGPLQVAEQLAAYLFVQPPATLGPEDVYLRIDTKGFANLDFSAEALDSLRAHGRAAADSLLPRALCLPRGSAATPPGPAERLAALRFEGGQQGDDRVLTQVLGLVLGAAVDEGMLRTQLLRLSDLDAWDAVWLRPRPAVDGIALVPLVDRASPRMAGVTVAYDNDLGGRMGLMYLDHHLFGTGLEGSGVATLSRIRTDLTLAVRRYFGYGRSRLAPAVIGRLAEHKIIRYDDGEEIGRPTTREAVLFAGLEREIGALWVFTLGGEVRAWRDADTTTGRTGGEDGHSGGLRLGVARYPGRFSVQAEGIWSGTFRRVHGEVAAHARLGRLTLTPRARAGWGERLPLQQTFPLGGSEGFPGLAVEELRGDRELYGSLQAEYLIRGPVSARLLFSSGRSASGGPFVGNEHWLLGARTGLGVETPIGPVYFEYGVASNGRDQLFVRIGRY